MTIRARLNRILLAAATALTILMAALPASAATETPEPPHAAEEQESTLTLPITQHWNVNGKGANMTAHYILTPETTSHQEGYESNTEQAVADGRILFRIGEQEANVGDFTMVGDKATTSVAFSWTSSGLYVFRLEGTDTDSEHYTYDHGTYLIRVYVRSDGNSFITVESPNGTKLAELILDPTYDNPQRPHHDGGGTGSVVIYKVDAADIDTRLAGARFIVSKTNGDMVTTITTDDQGMASIPSLEAGTYRLKEFRTPDGYAAEDRYIYFDVIRDTTVSSPTNVKVTNTRAEETIHVTATKQWANVDGVETPESVTLALVKDGVTTDVAQTVSADNDWTADFGLLPADGASYEVTEVDVPEHYSMSVETAITGSEVTYTITNTYLDTAGGDHRNAFTGDDSHMMLYAGAMGAAVVMLAGWFVVTRRSQ